MNLQEFARGLAKKQGMENALRIATSNAAAMKDIIDGGTGTPFYDEVEISTDDKGKDRVTVDDNAKSKRMKRTLAFWKNVHGTLVKLNGTAEFPKKQKAQA